jgi:hypothetical protein
MSNYVPMTQEELSELGFNDVVYTPYSDTVVLPNGKTTAVRERAFFQGTTKAGRFILHAPVRTPRGDVLGDVNVYTLGVGDVYKAAMKEGAK